MLRNQEVMSLQQAANRHPIADMEIQTVPVQEDEYLPEDDLAEDAVLSGATLASFALDDDYGDDVDPIADELSLMGFRADADFA